MKIGLCLLLVLFASAAMLSQTPAAPPTRSTASAVSPASVGNTSLTSIHPDLDRLGTVATQVALDIERLRIEKWKTNSDTKNAAQADADSVRRNLTSALPGMIDAVRSAPEDLNAEFKLYRNLNALIDVFGTLTQSTRAFGPKGDYEALAQQLQVIGSVRRDLGEVLEQLTANTQHELTQMRTQIAAQQQQLAAAAAAATPPPKVVVAQAEPAKKAAQKKRTAPKKPAAATGGSGSNATGSNATGQTGTVNSVPKS